MFKRTPNKPVRASLRTFEVVFRFLCGNKRYFCILHAEDFVAKGKYARAVSCNNAGLFCSAAAVEAASFCYYIADYQLLRLNIQSAGCLIKQQYRCIAQNCSCNGKPLRLSLAYAVSLFPDASMPPILVTKRSAHAASSAAVNSSSDASGRTMRRFSAIVPEKTVLPCGT